MTFPWSRQLNRSRTWIAVLAMIATGGLAAWAASSVIAHAGAPEQGSPGENMPVRLSQSTPTATPPGGKWSVVHAPNFRPLWANGAPTLRAVHGVTVAGGGWVGWAVGDNGAVVRYDGTDWAASYYDGTNLVPATSGIPPAGATDFQFRDVFMIAPDDVWVVGVNTADRFCGECGVLLHFDGSRLRNLDRSEFGVIGRVAPLNAIDMVKGEDGKWYGWAVGDDASFDNIKAIILHFQAGTWDLFKGPNNIAKDLHAVKVLSPDEAWAVGEDGSESWYDEVDQPGRGWPRLGHSGVDTLYTVDLADRLYGWDGGVGGRMNRYAGSCHDDTLATQCWFDNQARPIHDETGTSLNIDVYGVDLLSRTQGWVVGAAMSRQSLVAYLDGRYWRTTTVQGDPGRSLYGLQMFGPADGVAVGADGVILRYTDDTAPSPTNTGSPPPSATDDAQATPTHDLLETETPPTAPDGTVTATGTQTPTGTASPLTPGTPGGSPTTPGSTTTTPDVTATVTATEAPLPSPTDTPTPTETSMPSATPSVTPSATPTRRVADRLFVPLVLVAHTER